MKFLKKSFFLVFVISSVLLALIIYLDNSQTEVALRFFEYTSPVLTAGEWVIIFFCFGLLLGVLGNIPMALKNSVKLSRLEKQLKHKQAEIDLLNAKKE